MRITFCKKIEDNIMATLERYKTFEDLKSSKPTLGEEVAIASHQDFQVLMKKLYLTKLKQTENVYQ